MPGEGTAPAGVDHPYLTLADERDGDAVGHGHREAEVRLGADQRVRLTGEARPGDANHPIPRDLADPGRWPVDPWRSRIRERFSSTASGSSPTFLETFRRVVGVPETPPRRVKKKMLAPSGPGSGAT